MKWILIGLCFTLASCNSKDSGSTIPESSPGKVLPAEQATQSEASVRLSNLIRISKTYDIGVSMSRLVFPIECSSGVIQGSEASATDLAAYSTIFCSEFDHYPPSLVKESKLIRIVFCDNLRYNEERVGGLSVCQRFEMFLDAHLVRVRTKTDLQKSIHHEFFHIIDLRNGSDQRDDEQWIALNEPNFKYRTAERKTLTEPLSDTSRGFLNRYSTSTVREDKAEIFTYMMVDPTYMEKKAATDPIIKAKMQRTKDRLKEICPEIDEDFWNRIKISRSENGE